MVLQTICFLLKVATKIEIYIVSLVVELIIWYPKFMFIKL